MEIPYLINFKHLHHNDGYITIVENDENIPFQVNRVYWLTGVKNKQTRGNNATLEGKRIISAIKGKVEISLESHDGKKYQFTLDSPHSGLFVPNGYWSSIHFQKEATLICMVSNLFDENDYVRDYQQFLALDWKS